MQQKAFCNSIVLVGVESQFLALLGGNTDICDCQNPKLKN